MKRALLFFGLLILMAKITMAQFTASFIQSEYCFGQCNGFAAITPIGNYHYLWDDGKTYSADSNMCAGLHYCIVYDSVGNSLDTVHITISQPPPISVGNTVVNPTCNGGSNGSFAVSVTGGTAPYAYSWNNGVTTQSLVGVQPGYYALTITDANGCSISDFDSVTQQTPFYLNTQVFYLPSCNGTIVLSPQGGVRPFNFMLNGMSTGDSVFANEPPGEYYFVVTDSTNCTNIATVYVGPLADSTQFYPPTCNHLDTGVIAINVLGGTAPFSYLWNNGDTTNIIRHLSAGNYSVTITDHNGCQNVHVYNLNTQNNLGYYAWVGVTNANCSTNNGSVAVTPFGGAGPYTYRWNTIPAQTTPTATGLSAGQYMVTLTDHSGCEATGSAMVNYACNAVLSGVAFVDSNHNCIFDAGEQTYGGVLIQALSLTGNAYYGFTYANGQYSMNVSDTGTYTILTEGTSQNGLCSNIVPCNNNNTVHFAGTGDSILNYNFGIEPSNGFDLSIHPGWTDVSPGFEKNYWIFYYNQVLPGYYGPATITFKFDSNLVFASSDIPYTTFDSMTHTLTWVVDSVTRTWRQIGYVHLTVPVDLNPGYQLQSDFSISPTVGDCDSANNRLHFAEIVTGSHDPNAKAVEPASNISPDDSVLTYTIYFQNTGTASTVFIVVKDTLSPYLDPASVRNLASSLKYSSFNISGNGILTWQFNPGVLPDSIVDAQGSKGFITFSVKKKRSTPLSAVISNTAYIYFDYNKAVVTNTVTDTVAIPLGVSSVAGNADISVTAFPNPFKDATTIVVTGIAQPYELALYDLSGRVVKLLHANNESSIQLQRSELAPGMYLYGIVIGGKSVAYGKIVAE